MRVGLLVCLSTTTLIVALITGRIPYEAIPITTAAYTMLEALSW